MRHSAEQLSVDHKPSVKLVQLLSALGLSLVLASCTLSRTLETASTDENNVTGSISGAARQDGLNEKDAEMIKSTVVSGETFAQGSNVLAWENPETGNSGTITAIERTINSNGKPCRKFETTVASFGGVSIYNGEACEHKKGKWSLAWLLPKDFGI